MRGSADRRSSSLNALRSGVAFACRERGRLGGPPCATKSSRWTTCSCRGTKEACLIFGEKSRPETSAPANAEVQGSLRRMPGARPRRERSRGRCQRPHRVLDRESRHRPRLTAHPAPTAGGAPGSPGGVPLGLRPEGRGTAGGSRLASAVGGQPMAHALTSRPERSDGSVSGCHRQRRAAYRPRRGTSADLQGSADVVLSMNPADPVICDRCSPTSPLSPPGGSSTRWTASRSSTRSPAVCAGTRPQSSTGSIRRPLRDRA